VPCYFVGSTGILALRRREFITLLGTAAAWPLALRAQQPEGMRRIGVLSMFHETDAEPSVWLKAFQDQLQNLGWENGRNIRVESRLVDNNTQRLRSGAAEIVATKPDVIFAVTSPALTALKAETQTIPIVFVQVSDPVRLGFVTSLARPGGNITGFVTYEHAIGGKWVGLLKDIAPTTSRIAVVFDPENPSQPAYLQGIEAAAPAFGVQVTQPGTRNAGDLEQTIRAFAQHSNTGMIILPSSMAIHHRDFIINLAGRSRLPAVYPYRTFAQSDGLISYGADLRDAYAKAASYVDRILKGAKPGDLPVHLANKFELVVNLRTAKALGLTIPEPFLQQADEVIE
jgi:putative tryptophan/tyrosine transport system substrate-binding protein